MGVVTCQFTSTLQETISLPFATECSCPHLINQETMSNYNSDILKQRATFSSTAYCSNSHIISGGKKMVGLQEIYQAPATTVQCRENGFLSLTLSTHPTEYNIHNKHILVTKGTLLAQ